MIDITYNHTCDCDRCKAQRALAEISKGVLSANAVELDAIRTGIAKIMDELRNSNNVTKECV
jgi:hypothetical protein